MSFNKGFRLWSGRVGVAAAVLATIGAGYAYRALSARPGEGALRYVPSDALALVSFDLSPSPAQALTFKRIDDALGRNGLNGFLEKSLIDSLAQPQVAKAIRPYALRAGAIVCMPASKADHSDQPACVGFLSLSDGPAVNQILTMSIPPLFYRGLRYYKLGPSGILATVLDDQLALSNSPKSLYKVRQVATGDLPALIKTDAYLAARSKVASDANVFALISPEMLNQLGKTVPNRSLSPTSIEGWMSLGASVRDGGIEIDSNAKIDFDAQPTFKALAQISPLRHDLFDTLPGGAYAVMSTSSLSTFMEMSRTQFEAASQTGSTTSKNQGWKKSLRDNSGLDYDQDLLTAFKGDSVLAAYPRGTGENPEGLNLLMVLDDQNGADPAATAQKLANWVEKQIRKSDHSAKEALFVSKDVDGAHEYRLSSTYENEFKKSMKPSKQTAVHQDVLFGDKTVVWATINHAVLVATSQELLDRAIASYQAPAGATTASLSADTRYAKAVIGLLDGSQMVAMFSPARIAEGVQATMNFEEMSPDDQKNMHQVFAMFEGLSQPLVMHAGTSPNGTSSAGLFIPLDYDKIIDFAGAQMKKNGNVAAE